MNLIADKPVRLGDFVESLDSSSLQVGDWDVRTSFCNFVDKNYGACCDDTVPMQLIYEWWKAYLEDLIRMSYADQFHVNEYGCDEGDPIYIVWTASAGQNTLTAEKLFTAVPTTIGGQFDVWNQAGHVCASSVEPEDVYATLVKLLDRTFYTGEFLKPYGESKKESKLSEDVDGSFYVVHESPIGYKGQQGWVDDYSELTSDIGSAEHYGSLQEAVDMLYAIEDYVENLNDGEGIRATIQRVNPDNANQVLKDMAVVDICNNGVVNCKPVSGEQNLANGGYLTKCDWCGKKKVPIEDTRIDYSDSEDRVCDDYKEKL